MENIRSKYIIKSIFSLLKRTKFLSIITYSKNIQNKLNITLQDYSNISNISIIKENNITKLYRKDSDILLFEGKYEKGQKIEGKEYKLNQIYFIGRYKNNLKYKGKEFNKEGKLIYEGEYNKGLYWTGDFYFSKYSVKVGHLDNGCGIVKQFNFDCFLSFQGEYKNGFKYSGTEFNEEGKKIYEGKYKNNKRWEGIFFSPEQNYTSDIIEGNGKIEEYDIYENMIFKGELKSGIRYKGQGKEFYKYNGFLKYDVTYNNYVIVEGSYYNIKGIKEFEGKFKNENFIEGILYQEKDIFNCSIFQGKFKNNKKHEGIEINEVSAFIGEFDGYDNYLKGKYYQRNYNVIKKKELFEENSLKEIEISEIEKKGYLRFEGEFKKGRFYKGKEYKYNQINFEGEYKNGLYWNGKSYKIKDKYTSKMEGFEGTYINGAKKGKEIILDEEGNILMEKTYINSKNWNFIIYDKNGEIYGDVINGNSDYVVEYKTYIEDNEKEEGNKNKKVYKLYEGTYKDNKRYIGKEYYKDGDIKFKGEFKEGKYYYGKEYYYKGRLKFEGEYKNGKYYKGKEYYDHIEEFNYYEIYDVLRTYELRLKFEGIYKEGKMFKGWMYNLFGNLIFVGEYKSGFFWSGYFYHPGELMNQKKSGSINEGNGINIKIYDLSGQLRYEGDIINGKFSIFEFRRLHEITAQSENIKDIDLNAPYEKDITVAVYINLFEDENGKIRGNQTNHRNINGAKFYETFFRGEFKNGKYYEGTEKINYFYQYKGERRYEKGNIKKIRRKKMAKIDVNRIFYNIK